MLFTNQQNKTTRSRHTSKKRRTLSGPKAASSKTRRRGKKKAAKPKPLSNISMKPSISRLVKARGIAKKAVSALGKGTGGGVTENTIGKMLSDSRKEPVINLADSSEDSLTSDEDDSICLIKPSPKLTSEWWQYYHVYDRVRHPEMKHYAVCNVHPGCKAKIKVNNGTGGLRRHMEHKHYDAFYKQLYGPKDSTPPPSYPPGDTRLRNDWKTPPINRHFRQVDTVEKRKEQYLARSLYCSWKNNIAFSIFSRPSFRCLFDPFSRDAGAIAVTANRTSMRSGMLEIGEMAKECVSAERMGTKGASTSDHWTGNNNETYTTTSYHYIRDWKLHSLTLDFKVHEGTTTGQAVFEDVADVLCLNDPEQKPFCFYSNTDSTGNMGTLGAHLRENGVEHGYCVDHLLHLNATNAFKGEFPCAVMYMCTCSLTDI